MKVLVGFAIFLLSKARIDERGPPLYAKIGPWHAFTGMIPPLAGSFASLFHRPTYSGTRPVLRAFVRGTSFQIRVWRALLHVPKGALISYGRLAAVVGNPAAARAVGSAVGNDPVACLIPCHRVIRETGVFGEYRWEGTRKTAIIAWESALRIRSQSPSNQ